MEDFNRVEVENFVITCNDMLSGKFLDINKKLNEVLNTITKSDDILTFLADAITDFDEEETFTKAFVIDSKTKNGRFIAPHNEKERLVLTVTVFNDIQSGKINITRFLETFFKEGKLTPTQNFLDKFIRPFRTIICKAFGVDENVTLSEVEEHKKQMKERVMEEKKLEEEKAFEEQYPQIDTLIAEVQKVSREILSRLNFEKKKKDQLEDFEFILNALLASCETKNLLMINGLIVGINYVSEKFKSVKYLVRDLNDLIYDYYDFLAKNSQKNSKNLENFDDFNENWDEE